MSIPREVVSKARTANLYTYILNSHPEKVKKEGSSLRWKQNPSVCIGKDRCSYKDFSTDDKGNALDFLMKFLGYEFSSAVRELTGQGLQICEVYSEGPSGIPVNSELRIPIADQQPYRRVFAYLRSREIPAYTINDLIHSGILYQEAKTGNAVFITPEHDYCELRGTCSYTKPFHQCLKTQKDRFWYYKPSDRKPDTAYVCEAAIDAISLYTLHSIQGYAKNSVYVSIGGVANQSTIDRLVRGIPVILAVDNDEAGNLRRALNPNIDSISPEGKDWNEDLIRIMRSS